MGAVAKQAVQDEYYAYNLLNNSVLYISTTFHTETNYPKNCRKRRSEEQACRTGLKPMNQIETDVLAIGLSNLQSVDPFSRIYEKMIAEWYFLEFVVFIGI